MIDRKIATLCLLVATGIAGCAPETEKWTDGEAPKQLRVEHLRVQFTADFAPGSSAIDSVAKGKLEVFLAQAGIRPNDHVTIEAAAEDPLAATRINELAKELDRHGIGAQVQAATPGDGVAANHLVVVFDRYAMVLPNCPDWTPPPADDHGNDPSRNFGCANITNLGLMIDNPRDIVAGRTLGPADGEPGLNAIDRYRNDKVKPLPTNGGASGGGASGS